MTTDSLSRLRFISFLVLAVGALFITRLYFLQILHHDQYLKDAEKQYVATLPNSFDRGSIYFREKDGDLVAGATLASGWRLAITPADVREAEETYRKINTIVPLVHDEFLAKAKKTADPYEEVAERVSNESAVKIRALELPGVHLYRETWRTYPGGTLAAQTIGFIAYQGDTLTGRYGLERFYNDVLDRHEENISVNFFAELFSDLRAVVFDRNRVEAGDLVLTIEPSVQAYLESELGNIMKEWDSDASGGIIMDPKTGALYAMGVNPSFDVNAFNKVTDPALYMNPIVENQYEMGSIVKPLTVAVGLDTGVVTPKTLYNDTGTITLNKKTISNYDGRARGPGTPLQEVLSQSLNIGAVFVESKVGNDRFSDYFLNRYHLGEETGIDLPGEGRGITNNLHSKRDVEYATASFGQGFAVSPISMTVALASLGNGGTIVSPYVVDEVRYKDGRVKKITPLPGDQAIKKETSDEITRMLVTVVDKALLNGSVKVPEYSIAAKTGTAQLARPRDAGGGYYDDRYLHTFFGYFPAYDPKFIVFLYTYNPKKVDYASHTLTLPFMRIAKFLLHYYGIPPDRDPKAQSISLVPQPIPAETNRL
jgi:cell division protein FtsI/penicillin-binding protein 2